MTTEQERPADYLDLMLVTTAHARSYVEGLTKEDFLADPKTQDAVILKLLVIGELAAKLLVSMLLLWPTIQRYRGAR